jgi:hypothetical protein
MASSQHIIDEAYRVLETLQELSFPNRPPYLHPYNLLIALLHHAPALTGKIEIAKDILAQTQDDLITRLTNLADYFFYNLLLCIPLTAVLALT